MIKALIFDFDGLILETEEPCYQSWQEIYQDHGHSLDLTTYISTIGSSSDHFDPYDNLEKTVGFPIDRESIRTRRRQRHLEFAASQPIMPGVIDYLTDAKRLGLKTGLASSSSREWIMHHLNRLNLISMFNSIKCADDVRRTKPEPDLYLVALADLGVTGDEALVLEDSPNGVLAANRAGIRVVAVPSPLTRELDFSHADLLLSSLGAISLESLLGNFS